jgi:hypothetical protein
MANHKRLNKSEIRSMVQFLIKESMDFSEEEKESIKRFGRRTPEREEFARLVKDLALCAERLEKFMDNKAKTADLPMDWLTRESPIQEPLEYWVDGFFDWYYSITEPFDRK